MRAVRNIQDVRSLQYIIIQDVGFLNTTKQHMRPDLLESGFHTRLEDYQQLLNVKCHYV